MLWELNLRSAFKKDLVPQKVSTAACDPGMKRERVSFQTFPASAKNSGRLWV